MTKFIVSVSDIEKKYKNKNILNGINFEIYSEEVYSLLGVNGAGKTTLIKCLLNFHGIDNGNIKLFDIDSHETVSRKNMAYLPERFLPPHYFNGQQFLNYIFELHKVKKEQSVILKMFDDLDLSKDILTKPVHKFSKGMAQKLGLAALLLLDKKLLILDEPMSGLDPKARALVKRQLKLAKEKGKTIFFSSHLLADVEELSDRIGILHEGSIAFCGSPAECKQQYNADTLEQAFLNCID